MKLISLNVEGKAHLHTVAPFLINEQADVVCLQEAHEGYEMFLTEHGYTTNFMPRCLKVQEGGSYEDGQIIASRFPVSTFRHFYYYTPENDSVALETSDDTTQRKTSRQGFILAEIKMPEATFQVATTHFTWTPQGDIPNKAQVRDMDAFIHLIENLPPHIMCGDFNIPRYYNPLFEELVKKYEDNIPREYKSSLDKNMHRLGKDSSKADIFEKYMVDYVFTQKPYVASDVRLQFGISDHAAVVATITQ